MEEVYLHTTPPSPPSQPVQPPSLTHNMRWTLTWQEGISLFDHHHDLSKTSKHHQGGAWDVFEMLVCHKNEREGIPEGGCTGYSHKLSFPILFTNISSPGPTKLQCNERVIPSHCVEFLPSRHDKKDTLLCQFRYSKGNPLVMSETQHRGLMVGIGPSTLHFEQQGDSHPPPIPPLLLEIWQEAQGFYAHHSSCLVLSNLTPLTQNLTWRGCIHTYYPSCRVSATPHL